MLSASSPKAWGASGATRGWPRMRRCAVVIWAVRVAHMAHSCSRVRGVARSRSCEAATTAWMLATSAEDVGGGAVEEATLSAYVGAVGVKPGGGQRGRCCAGERDEPGGSSTASAPVRRGAVLASGVSQRSTEDGRPSGRPAGRADLLLLQQVRGHARRWGEEVPTLAARPAPAVREASRPALGAVAVDAGERGGAAVIGSMVGDWRGRRCLGRVRGEHPRLGEEADGGRRLGKSRRRSAGRGREGADDGWEGEGVKKSEN
jgi:hypothetical protein